MVVARKPVHPPSEIELKLEFDPADAQRLSSHPALKEGKSEERAPISTYFDTPACDLHKSGVYLRIREDGGRRVQTIKAAKSKDELIERFEWEREVSSRTPELDQADGTALEAVLTSEIRARLQPVFETRIRRNIRLVERNGSKIEASIDVGEIATRDRTRPVSELELELKQGDKKELFRLARLLAETVPLRLEVKTKAERGYELLLEEDLPKAEKAAEVAVPPAITAADALRTIALSCLRQIIANEPGVCSGHAEALHQMRIGLRRLRAALAIFDELLPEEDLERTKSELKWITRQLGPARDLDVFATDVLAPLKAEHPDDQTIAAALRDVEAKRKEAYATAIEAVRSDRFRNVLLDFAEWIEAGAWASDDDEQRKTLRNQTAAEHAKAALRKLRKRIKKKGAQLRQLSVPQRHRLRIRAKRLRYGTEFFAGTFPGEAAAKRRAQSLSALKDLQDALGGLNDIATHRTLIADEFADVAKAGASGEAKRRLAPAEERAEQLLVKSEEAFERFAATKPFWKE